MKEIISNCIDYIIQHLDEDLSVEDIAKYCNFSKYHFSRMFKLETGEGIYEFIKRMKLEYSALDLKLSKESSITDVGASYGYSASNYSTAFKKHHNISPAEFRFAIGANELKNPFYKNDLVDFNTFEAYDNKINISEIENFFVIYERHIGAYKEIGEKWTLFTEKYSSYLKEDTILIERSYHDPLVTSPEKCIYDMCITTKKDCDLENKTVIEGGKFIIYPFKGYVRDIFDEFQGIFVNWLPYSSYHMDKKFVLNIYREIDWENMHVAMDICIPVKLSTNSEV